jgi:dienelactone hydrolase
MSSATNDTTTYIDRPTGRIAYDLIGDGPLVICLPGMGDVRSVYRFLAQALAEAGFRLAGGGGVRGPNHTARRLNSR